MTAQIIDGKKIAKSIRADIAARAADMLRDKGVQPGLSVVLVGDNPASQIYVANKQKYAQKVGFKSDVYRLPATATQADVLQLVKRLNADASVHGILVQLPLPPQIDMATVLLTIDPAKDVDGLHPHNVGLLSVGAPGLVPCTPLGCLRLIKSVRGDKLAGLNAVVIGRSNLVGKPMAQMLMNEHCQVTTIHRQTQNPADVARGADILVVAAGQMGLVRADWVKPGATVIDVGINTKPDGSLTGDVDFDAAQKIAAHITPVPGGVGPMTIACLLDNTLKAAEMQIAAQPKNGPARIKSPKNGI
jgi:methylenetetrahydrofolate dehydrogenase (NADP+)/methenyltetrahydrofolate cyclohydrolase